MRCAWISQLLLRFYTYTHTYIHTHPSFPEVELMTFSKSQRQISRAWALDLYSMVKCSTYNLEL